MVRTAGGISLAKAKTATGSTPTYMALGEYASTRPYPLARWDARPTRRGSGASLLLWMVAYGVLGSVGDSTVYRPIS